MTEAPELLHTVSGPHRLYVRRIPAGVGLDFGHLVESLLVELAQRYEEDPEGVGEDLTRIAELASSAAHQGRDSHARHDLDDATEALLEELGGAEQHLYGDQVRRLAETLRVAAGEPVDEPEKDTPAGGESTAAVTEAYPGELEHLRSFLWRVYEFAAARPDGDPLMALVTAHHRDADAVGRALSALLPAGGEGR